MHLAGACLFAVLAHTSGNREGDKKTKRQTGRVRTRQRRSSGLAALEGNSVFLHCFSPDQGFGAGADSFPPAGCCCRCVTMASLM